MRRTNCSSLASLPPKGLPKFDLPSLDPYFTEHQRTVYEANDIHADITVTNVNTYGLAKAKFLAVRPSYSDDFFKLEADVEVPKMLMEGNFKAEGAMGTIQIGGDGTSIDRDCALQT